MKKKLALLLALTMAFTCLVGCGEKKETPDTGDQDSQQEVKSDYPKKNVSVIVPFGAGGNTDMSIRALLNTATEVADENYTFVVDNKTGNSGLIGMEALAESDADGYTLGATCIDLMLHICFDRTEKTMDDFIPIACTMADPYGLVISTSNPNFSTVEEFVEYAKANPSAVKVADSGVGGAPNVAARAFENTFGITFDIYTYDGSADCVTAIETGEVDATFTQPTPAAASIKGGTQKMIAVLSDERLDSYPDTPTLHEVFGEDAGLVLKGWVALTAPAGTPDAIVDQLAELMGKALETDEYKAQIESLGMEYIVLYGDKLTTFLGEQMAFFEEVCAGIDINV